MHFIYTYPRNRAVFIPPLRRRSVADNMLISHSYIYTVCMYRTVVKATDCGIDHFSFPND